MITPEEGPAATLPFEPSSAGRTMAGSTPRASYLAFRRADEARNGRENRASLTAAAGTLLRNRGHAPAFRSGYGYLRHSDEPHSEFAPSDRPVCNVYLDPGDGDTGPGSYGGRGDAPG